jgi:hypothetical protein
MSNWYPKHAIKTEAELRELVARAIKEGPIEIWLAIPSKSEDEKPAKLILDKDTTLEEGNVMYYLYGTNDSPGYYWMPRGEAFLPYVGCSPSGIYIKENLGYLFTNFWHALLYMHHAKKKAA